MACANRPVWSHGFVSRIFANCSGLFSAGYGVNHARSSRRLHSLHTGWGPVVRQGRGSPAGTHRSNGRLGRIILAVQDIPVLRANDAAASLIYYWMWDGANYDGVKYACS